MNITRRTFVSAAAVALAAPAIIRPSRGEAQFKLRYANELPLRNPVNVRFAAAAKAISEETGGAVQIDIFPSGQLGGGADLVSQVTSGALDFYTPGMGLLASMKPVAATNGVGYAFKDYSQVWQAMDGDLGSMVRTQFEETPLHLFERGWELGFRQITTSTKPVITPADLVGMKLRVPSAPLYVSLFTALGAVTTAIQYSDVYVSLQTKIVDGQENPLSLIVDAQFFEVQKYLSVSNHMWDGYWLITNRAMWSSIPADVSAVVSKHLNDAAVLQRGDVATAEKEGLAFLKDKGMEIAEVDTAAFREVLKTKGFYSEWQEKLGAEAWALLEKYSGPLS